MESCLLLRSTDGRAAAFCLKIMIDRRPTHQNRLLIRTGKFIFFFPFLLSDVFIGEFMGDASDRFAAQSRRTQSRPLLSHSDGRHLLEFGQLSRSYRDRRRAQVNIRPKPHAQSRTHNSLFHTRRVCPNLFTIIIFSPSFFPFGRSTVRQCLSIAVYGAVLFLEQEKIYSNK